MAIASTPKSAVDSVRAATTVTINVTDLLTTSAIVFKATLETRRRDDSFVVVEDTPPRRTLLT